MWYSTGHKLKTCRFYLFSLLYNRHIEKVLNLLLHRFRNNITPVCPILRPQCPVNCHCAFYPHCALHCCHVAVVPSMSSRRRRAFDRRCPCAVHRRRQCCIVITPSIANAVAIAVASSITVVAIALPCCHPLPSLLPRYRHVFHCHHCLIPSSLLSHRAFHCCCCCCVVVAPSITVHHRLRCVAAMPSRRHCRRRRRCRRCRYCRHHHRPLLLIPLLVGCCVVASPSRRCVAVVAAAVAVAITATATATTHLC